MGAAIQSETAAAEPDPTGLEAGELRIRPELTTLDTVLGVPAPDHQPMPTRRSSLGLSQLISVSGWRLRKQAALQAQLEDAEARCLQLEEALPGRIAAVRREVDTAHAANVEALEAQAAEQLEATRRDAETALAILATELETRAVAQVEAAVSSAQDAAERVAADVARQHDAALTALQAQLEDTEAGRVRLEADFPTRVAAVRHEADTALAARETELRAEASTQLAAAERVAADVARQHDAALAATRAQLEDVEARRAQLEDDLPMRVAAVRQEADTLHTAQVAALKAQAAAQLEAGVRAAQAEAAQTLVETVQQHDAVLAAVRTQLDDTEAGRVRLEADLPVRVAAVRQEADAAHAAQVAALAAQAGAQLELTRRDAEAALAILATELETQAAAQVAAEVGAARADAGRVAAEVA